MNIIKKVKIYLLKQQMKYHYIKVVDSYVGDAGNALSDYIRPERIKHKIKFNNVADKLCELDSTTPTFRFKTI